MSEHQAVTTFSRRVVLNDDSAERSKPEKRFAQRFASVLALFAVLAIVCAGGLVAFTGLLMGYPKKLKRLPDTRQLVKRPQESSVGQPDITMLPSNYRGSDDHKSFQRAAENNGDHGSLDSPFCLSNRLCG